MMRAFFRKHTYEVTREKKIFLSKYSWEKEHNTQRVVGNEKFI